MSESLADQKLLHNVLDAWDPLAASDDDVDMFAAAQKREIRNILKSYTGYYDLFSEMVQNALDAVEKRSSENIAGYMPSISITIGIMHQYLTGRRALILCGRRVAEPSGRTGVQLCSAER
jgi:hypothetical protein